MSEGASRLPLRPSVPVALYALVAVMGVSYGVMSNGGVPAACRWLVLGLSRCWQLACGCALAVGLVVTWRLRHPASSPVGSSARGVLPARPAPARRGPGLAALGRAVRWGGALLPVVALVALSAVAASVSSTAALREGEALVHALGTGSLDAWELTVMTDPSQTERGAWRCRVHASRAGCPEGDLWLTTSVPCEIGDVVHVSNGFVANQDDEWGRINRSQGVWGRLLPKGEGVVRVEGPRGPMRLVRSLRDGARRLVDPYSSESRAILAGCVIGDRRAMDELGLSEVFSSCGVSHLIAVSGGHIVIMGQVLGLLLDRLRLRPLPRLALLVMLSGVYVLLTGAPSPAVRSWVMAVVTYGAHLVGRRSDALSAVALVGLAMVLVDPGSAGQIGFVLSVVCVAGLCLFAGYVTYVLGVVAQARRPRGLPRGAWHAWSVFRDTTCETLGATLVAQLVTAPVTVPVFMQLSLVAPLANVLLTLPFTLLIGVGLVAACLPVPAPLASLALALCDVVSLLVMRLLRLMAAIPYASVPFDLDGLTSTVVAVTLGVIVLVAWPRLGRRGAGALVGGAAALLAAYVLRWGVLAPARIVVLDVGQGDAILVQDGAAAILVDAGPDDAVRRALARNHVLRLDAVVITHLHDDHYGGVTALPGFIGVGRVLVGDGAGEADPADATTYNGRNLAALRDAVASLTGTDRPGELGYGDVIRVGGFALRVVWPQVPVAGNENAHSIELAVAYEGAGGDRLSALLTGDAERDETGAVVAAADVGDIDFLKVGHHGSAVSIDDAGARALAPELAVASAGEGNRYGHPKAECVDILESAGALFLCTKDVGDVCVTPGADGVRVTCQRDVADP